MSINYKEKLLENFLRYTAISSQSDSSVKKLPSSPGQMDLARVLKKELLDLGLVDVKLTDEAILTARLKKTVDRDDVATVGFVAHLDTVDVALSPDIHPQLMHFDGSDILLNKEKNIVLKVEEHPEIIPYKGDDILVSDGTSVLGADDKSAIANVMTALEVLIKDKPFEHGDIIVAFTPDEEIGLLGAKKLNLDDFPVDFAYTMDSCELGEVVYETLNAGSAIVEVTGVSAHTMSAKGVGVNSLLIVNDFISLFDRKDTPEHTEGREGYIAVRRLNGNDYISTVRLAIGDFDKENFEKRKLLVQDNVEKMKKANPKAKFSCEIKDVFGNINDYLSDKTPLNYIYEAMENLGIKAKITPMRGGTDGSALSPRGIPTPNYFTGAHNFHSIYEFLPMNSFQKSLEVTLEILRLTASK